MIRNETGEDVYTVRCSGGVADRIRIVQPNNYLTLCEVKVFGVAAADDTNESSTEELDEDVLRTESTQIAGEEICYNFSTATNLADFKDCTVIEGDLVIDPQSMKR